MPEKVKRKTSANPKILPVCFLCNQVPAEGISSGFFLRGLFICGSCEQELINANVEESGKYKIALDKFRKILFKKSSGIHLPVLHKYK